MMLKWYRQHEEVENTLEKLNIIFTVIFCFEAFLRITAIGFSNYFKDSWNLFDFIIALGSLLGIMLN
jgi:voltage-dependent calcium channel R type alpha-1E